LHQIKEHFQNNKFEILETTITERIDIDVNEINGFAPPFNKMKIKQLSPIRILLIVKKL